MTQTAFGQVARADQTEDHSLALCAIPSTSDLLALQTGDGGEVAVVKPGRQLSLMTSNSWPLVYVQTIDKQRKMVVCGGRSCSTAELGSLSGRVTGWQWWWPCAISLLSHFPLVASSDSGSLDWSWRCCSAAASAASTAWGLGLCWRAQLLCGRRDRPITRIVQFFL